MTQRKIIVHIAMSADGYIARTDGDIDWLTARPAPAGFYGIEAFMKTIDTKVLGRKTYEASLGMGASLIPGNGPLSVHVNRVQKMLHLVLNLRTRQLTCWRIDCEKAKARISG